MARENWGSRIGIIMAVAGSAVGLGNFLRFPAKATMNGGAAFMIPYFIAFILLGIPLMWVEWTMGRMGGQLGHGTAPGIFDMMIKRPWAKYLGTIAVVGPFILLMYYMFVESWTLAYSCYSFSGHLFKVIDQPSMRAFLAGYQGLEHNQFFSGLGAAYLFFVITFLVNFYFIYRGVQGGIEKLSKYGMPLLVVIGIILAVRVLTLGTPDPARPDLSIRNALGFVWNPDLRALTNAKVWLEAAGQIFFTLSLGMGTILTYSSYLKKKDDVTLSGLTASSTNEFCEVVLGGSIIIPAAFVFFGAAGAVEVAQSGTFNIGFISMPLIFAKMPLGFVFSGLWFVLLFIAGITSSVSLIQPAIALLEDELKWSRRKSTIVLGLVTFLACQPAIFFIGNGVLDELDFWGATFLIVVFATIEIVIFSWIFGVEKGWREMHEGAKLRVPSFYRFIIKYVTPLYLITMLAVWTYQDFWKTIMMENVPPENKPYVWGTRILIALLWTAPIAIIRIVWSRRERALARSGEAA